MKKLIITLLNGPQYEVELSKVSPEAVLLPMNNPALAEVCHFIACNGIQHPDKRCAWIAPANISEVELVMEEKKIILPSSERTLMGDYKADAG